MPESRLARLPPWISRWLGYRAEPPPKQPLYVVCFWAFLGAFIGLSILQGIFLHTEYFRSRDVPGLIASYGASAVLCYLAIDSPLAQPRALLGGHLLAALLGTAIAQLFAQLPDAAAFERLRWLAASLSTAAAIALMAATETTHPPAGATALLPATSDAVFRLGWYYVPVVLLSSALVLASALLVNNVQRRYPAFWWTPVRASGVEPLPPTAAKEDLERATRSERSNSGEQ